MEAVDEFLATNDEFHRDREAERLMFTMHPKGYLKKIKSAVPLYEFIRNSSETLSLTADFLSNDRHKYHDAIDR